MFIYEVYCSFWTMTHPVRSREDTWTDQIYITQAEIDLQNLQDFANIRDHSSVAWLHVGPICDRTVSRDRLPRDGSPHLNVCRWWQTSFIPLISSTSATALPVSPPSSHLSPLSHISGHSHSLLLTLLPFSLLVLPRAPPPPTSFVFSQLPPLSLPYTNSTDSA